MTNIECIDPRLGEEIATLMEMPAEHNIDHFSSEPSSLSEPRLHWYSCPSCRAAYPEAEEVMKTVRQGVKRWAMKTLSQICDRYLIEDDSPRPSDSPHEFYANKLASLMVNGDQHHESDVQWALCYAVEGLPDFTVRCDSQDESSQRVPLSQCSDFILSLEPKAQSLVFASVLCHEMYYALYRRAYRKTQDVLIHVDPQTEKFIREANEEYEHPYDTAFIRACVRDSFMGSEVPPEVAYHSVQAAASEYLRRFKAGGGSRGGLEPLQDCSGRDGSSGFADELKFDLANGFDSLKAGQNEVLRLIEQNSRPASAFEPDIEMRLGIVYRLLEQKTQRLLQVSEYLYQINKAEPNYFHGPVMMMAAAYENELNVRIVGRYIVHLLKDGTRTYCFQSSTQPLIDRGSPQNLTLGNMRWYLKNDVQLRQWACTIGFSSVDAIADEAGWLTGIRNRAAHQPILERSFADEVRRRMLQSDGMLARLFAAGAEA